MVGEYGDWLLGVARLAGNRDLLSSLLYNLVATDTACFGLLGVEGSVERVLSLLSGLVMTAGSCTTLYLGLAVPRVMTGYTFHLGRAVLGVGKVDQRLGRLHPFWGTKLEIGGSFDCCPGKGGCQN